MLLSQNIDLQNGVLGGLVIGIASSAMLYWTGKVTGISGVVEGVIVANHGENKSWTLSYFSGLLSAGAVLVHVYPQAFGEGHQLLLLNPLGYASAGLLTGFGTRMGSGCTSGHGICGLPRRSVRSLAAVLTFMGTGAISSYLAMNTSLKHLIAADSMANTDTSDDIVFYVIPTVAVAIVGATLCNRNFLLNNMVFGGDENNSIDTDKDSNMQADPASHLTKHIISFSSALLFGMGLGVSGMCNTQRVTDFLNFSGSAGWDPTLMGVMGGGVIFNLFSFHFMHVNNHAIPCENTKKMGNVIKMDFHPDNLKIDWKLITGSAIFGLGWGLGKKFHEL